MWIIFARCWSAVRRYGLVQWLEDVLVQVIDVVVEDFVVAAELAYQKFLTRGEHAELAGFPVREDSKDVGIVHRDLSYSTPTGKEATLRSGCPAYPIFGEKGNLLGDMGTNNLRVRNSRTGGHHILELEKDPIQAKSEGGRGCGFVRRRGSGGRGGKLLHLGPSAKDGPGWGGWYHRKVGWEWEQFDSHLDRLFAFGNSLRRNQSPGFDCCFRDRFVESAEGAVAHSVVSGHQGPARGTRD